MGRWAEYEAYMQSQRWRKRKALFFETNKKICRRCNATKRIHLHHLTYANIGNELDEDLMVLCEPCHKEAHEYCRLNKLQIRCGTLQFLGEKPKVLQLKTVFPYRPKRRYGPKKKGSRKQKTAKLRSGAAQAVMAEALDAFNNRQRRLTPSSDGSEIQQESSKSS